MTKKTNRLKAPAHTTITRDQAEVLLYDIGVAQRSIQEFETEMNQAIEFVKKRYVQRAAKYNERIAEYFAKLQAWAEANRGDLCGNGKTAKLATGVLTWRTRPPSVKLTNTDKAIAALRAAQLEHCLRTKEEVDKEAVLADPAAVKGIKYIKIVTGVEDFVATPTVSKIESVQLAMQVAA